MTLQLNKDKLLAASAPVIWGSSYIVTTELLPDLSPLTVAALRALPAGLLMLAITRNLPTRDWWGKLLVLGALNFSIFWAALFVAAYRLPGGVAATLGAVQPLFVLFLASVLLGTSLTVRGVAAAVTGMLGVAVLVLGPNAGLDATGTLAALIGAGSMATGVVLTRLWQPPVSALTFTAWQLTAGGLLLLPVAVWVDPPLPSLTLSHLTGLVWLSVIGAALTYVFWFRAIERLGPAAITSLGFLSPLSAVLLGWILLGQTLSAWQILGAGIVLVSVWAGQKSRKPKRA